MRNIVFIPLRKGSKSIKNKNFKKFCGKPLFCWCIDAVIASGIADEIWIATNCPKIEKITQEKYTHNVVNIYHRQEQNAQDASPSIDVVMEFLNTMHFNRNDNFILVQATSPLTDSSDFLKLQSSLLKNKYDSYLACVRLKKFRWTDDGLPLDYDLKNKPRRQDYKGFLTESGAFYCSKVGSIITSGELVSGKIGIVELGNEAIIDIDEPVDWKMGEAYMRYMQNNKQ